jgi:hypothetical protein
MSCCPIGLECLSENNCPNDHYCSNLSAPWPLPYQIWEIDYWYDPGALIVSIPDLTNWEEVSNTDHAIDQADSYDAWIRYIRRELAKSGWQNAVDLPYFWDEIEKGLIITLPLIFEEERSGHPAQGFAPAVALDNWRANWEGYRTQLQIQTGEKRTPPQRDKWGFYLPNGVPGLAWKWQEDDQDDD